MTENRDDEPNETPGQTAPRPRYYGPRRRPATSDSMARFIQEQVYECNFDILCVSSRLLTFPRNGISKAVDRCISNLEGKTISQVLDSDFPRWEREDICNIVFWTSILFDVFTYPDEPERFWIELLEDYERAWPFKQRKAGVRVTEEQRRQCLSVVDKVWRCRNKAMVPSGATSPERSRGYPSEEDCKRFQRDFFAYDLGCRKDLLERVIPAHRRRRTGDWVAGQKAGNGVDSFLKLLTVMPRHIIARRENMDEAELYMEMQNRGWGLFCVIGGVRHWGRLLMIDTYTHAFARYHLDRAKDLLNFYCTGRHEKRRWQDRWFHVQWVNTTYATDPAEIDDEDTA